MAYTIAHQPNTTSGITAAGALRPVVFVAADLSQISEPKYRYVLQMSIDGNIVATLTAQPNANGYGVFNIAPIVRDYLEPTYHVNGTPVHSKGTTTADTTMYKAVTLNFGYRFASDAESQSETTLGQQVLTAHVFRADFNPPTDKYTTTNIADYVAASTSKFLSPMPLRRDVHDTDYGTISMLTDFSSSFRANYLEVKYYNGTTALNTGYVPWNTSWTGTSKLGMVPAYPASLEATGEPNAVPSDNAGWTHYTLQAKSGNLAGSSVRSQLYRFDRVTDCPEPTTQLAWVNELGAWEYLTMRGQINAKGTIATETFEQVPGNPHTAGPTAYEFYPWDGGMQSYLVSERQQLTLHTGTLREDMNPVIQSLRRSRWVLVSHLGWQRARVTETQYTIQTTYSDQHIEYSINIELAGQIQPQ